QRRARLAAPSAGRVEQQRRHPVLGPATVLPAEHPGLEPAEQPRHRCGQLREADTVRPGWRHLDSHARTLLPYPRRPMRRLVILTEGNFGPHHGKTAMGVIRYGTEPIAAVLDSS